MSNGKSKLITLDTHWKSIPRATPDSESLLDLCADLFFFCGWSRTRSSDAMIISYIPWLNWLTAWQRIFDGSSELRTHAFMLNCSRKSFNLKIVFKKCVSYKWKIFWIIQRLVLFREKIRRQSFVSQSINGMLNHAVQLHFSSLVNVKSFLKLYSNKLEIA